MKILRLFGKNTDRHVRGANITQPSEEARTTSLKIDAIESAMSAEFSATQIMEEQKSAAIDRPPAAAAAEIILPQCIEEAAILFASGQPDAAIDLLINATTEATAHAQEPLAWWMLFDLCQLHAQQARFEQLALAYANRFETSPPQWNSMMPVIGKTHKTASVTTLNFSGKLCATSQPLLERLHKLGEPHQQLCVELGVISDIDHAGCKQLLHILHDWQAGQRHVMLNGAQGLIDKIRSLIQPGQHDQPDQPDDTEAAWLLLIELFRLMNDQANHEETCIAYCITFEVSPPAFNPPPQHKTPPTGKVFLPAFIEAPVDSLLQSIAQAASGQSTVVLDCAQLACIHFTAAAPLIAGLLRLANGKPVELHNTNFLVSVLLRLVGSKSLQINTRKL